MAYLTQSDVENRIGTQILAVIFNNGAGGINATALADVLQAASDWVDSSCLALVYEGELPLTQDPVPPMVKEAALLFSIAFSYDRKPELIRQAGDGGRIDYRKLAEGVCKDIKLNIKRIVGYTAEPNPTNVGGGVYTGTSDETPDGVGTGIFANGFGSF